jgi:magnesium-transporting ATPase (P-type)
MPSTDLTTAPSGDPPPAGDASTVEVSEVLARLDTDAAGGLPAAVAAARLAEHGPNELQSAPAVPAWRRLVAQLADPVVYLLLAAIAIAIAAWLVEGPSGVPLDATAIAVIVVLNAMIGYFQESRAEQAVAALRDLTRTEATVVRDGERQRIASAELVPGDVVLLADGDLVPADARLIEVAALRVAEATLTGESAPVSKSTDAVGPDALLGDRAGMVYSGTAVVSGRARAVVTATGLATEVGKIATLLEETEQQDTPLQREIEQVGKLLGVAVMVIATVVVATLVVVADLRSGPELIDALLIGVSLAVAAVPEGLPAVLSVVLALGVQRMSQRNALVKRLASVETLGSATVICTDKTGTLTRNEMTVRRMVVPSGEIELTGTGYGPAGMLLLDGVELDAADGAGGAAISDEVQWVLVGGVLASDASVSLVEGDFVPLGDPTEAAIVAAQPKAGIEPEQLGRRFARMAEIPFTSERKRMSTVQADSDDEGRLIMAAKGAPDILLERCHAERRGGKVVPLNDERRRWWLQQVEAMAADALRTLAIAYRPVGDAELDTELDGEAETDLVLLGVVGIMDPPREEVRQAIDVAHRAGIRVVMITGDHPATATEIAAELAIVEPDGRTVTGRELASMSDAELDRLAPDVAVYARVAPEHKLRIVRSMTSAGEVVAMTGDGVNDAPALKAADIGVAMGITGTDVSKEAADMILTDDNFATIVAAVGEGRAIFHNIRSFLRYLLSSNIGEVLTVFLGTVGAGAIGLAASAGDGIAAPLLATQILWINLVTDSGPALALGIDPATPGLMDRRPRRLSERIIDRRMQAGIGLVGLTMAVATLVMLDLRLPGGLFEGDQDLTTARTGAFTALVLAQLFNTFNARSDTETIWGRIFSNWWLLAAIAVSIGLQVAVVYLPFLNDAFGTAPLSLADWLLAAGLASTVIWVSELRKAVLRRVTPRSELD